MRNPLLWLFKIALKIKFCCLFFSHWPCSPTTFITNINNMKVYLCWFTSEIKRNLPYYVCIIGIRLWYILKEIIKYLKPFFKCVCKTKNIYKVSSIVNIAVSLASAIYKIWSYLLVSFWKSLVLQHKSSSWMVRNISCRGLLLSFPEENKVIII